MQDCVAQVLIVIVVDEDVRAVLVDYLAHERFEVVALKDGLAALRWLERN